MVRRADTVRAWALLSVGVSLALITLPGSAAAQVPVRIPVTVAPQAAALASEPSSICASDRNCAYIVVDADTGRVLYEENAQATRHPASITKVMTVYLLLEALESGQVQLDDRIPISRRAAGATPTKLGVRAGSTISVEDAINALMIRSANDVAIAVGEFLGGSEGRFAEMMTQRARELGMGSTTFRNASGLPDSRQVTSAEDLARLAIAIRRDFPQYYHIFSRTEFMFEGQLITGHNRPLASVDGVDGLKTGFVRASGFNLATTATRGGRRLVVVVLGGNTGAERDAQVTQLVEAGFAEMGVARAVQAPLPAPVMGLADARDAVDALNLVPEIPRIAMGPAPVRVAGLTTSSRTVEAAVRPGQARWAAPRSTPGAEVQTAQVTPPLTPPQANPVLTAPVLTGPVVTAPALTATALTAPVEAIQVADAGPGLSPPPVTAGSAPARPAATSQMPPVATPAVAVVMMAERAPAGAVDSPTPSSGAVIEFVASESAPVEMAAAETVSVRAPEAGDVAVPAVTAPVQVAALTIPRGDRPGLRGTREPSGLLSPVSLDGIASQAGLADMASGLEPAAGSALPSSGLAAAGLTNSGPTDSGPTDSGPTDSGLRPALRDPPPVRFAQLDTDTGPITDEPPATALNTEATADLGDLFTLPTAAAVPTSDATADAAPEGTIRLAAAAADPVAETAMATEAAAVMDARDGADTGVLNGQVVMSAAFDPQGLSVEAGAAAGGAEPATAVAASDTAGSGLTPGPVVDGQPVLVPDPPAVEAARRAQAEADARTAQRLADIEAAEAEARRAREAEQRRVADQRRQDEARRAREEETRRQAEARERAARDQAAREERERQQRLAQARGNVTVQVGALRGEEQAEDLLAQSRRFFPSFASGEVTSARTDSGTWFRVRFGGMALEAAQEACRRVTRAGGQCEIVAR